MEALSRMIEASAKMRLSSKVEEKDIQAIVNAEIAKMISRPISDMQVIYQKIDINKKIKIYFFISYCCSKKHLLLFILLYSKKLV